MRNLMLIESKVFSYFYFSIGDKYTIAVFNCYIFPKLNQISLDFGHLSWPALAWWAWQSYNG